MVVGGMEDTQIARGHQRHAPDLLEQPLLRGPVDQHRVVELHRQRVVRGLRLKPILLGAAGVDRGIAPAVRLDVPGELGRERVGFEHCTKSAAGGSPPCTSSLLVASPGIAPSRLPDQIRVVIIK